ncbi:YccT family protein [Vibrio sp. NH-7]
MKALSIVIMMLLTASVNAASLEPKKGTNFLFLNGVELDDKREVVDIQSGPIQIIVKYSKKLKDSGEDRVFDSNPFVISFEATNDDISVVPPKLYTYEQANRAFKNSPEWVIRTADGKPIEYTQEALDRSEGFMPYFNMPERVAKHNEARGIVFGSSAALVAKAAVAEQATPAVPNTQAKSDKVIKPLDTNNLEQLKAWYVKASKQERKEFRRWMIDQE